MEVKIVNFRGTEKRKLFFSKGLTLLSGESGAGKSTILDAITWCLYGKVRNIRNTRDDSLKVKVEIKLFDLSIKRQTNPSKLVVVDDEDKFESKSAQSLIDDKFGDFNIWMCGSYLKQKSRPEFVCCSSKKKWNILNSIAFSEKDPSVYIEKIEKEVSEAKKRLNYYRKEYEIANGVNKALKKELKPVFTEITKSKLKRKKRKLEKLERSLPGMKKSLKKQNINLGKKKEIINQLKSIGDIVDPKLQDKIAEMETKVSEYDKSMKKWKRNQELKKKLKEAEDKLKKLDVKPFNHDKKSIRNARRSELKRASNISDLKSIDPSVDYTNKSINNKIKFLKSKLENLKQKQKLFEINESIDRLEEKIKHLGDFDETDEEMLSKEKLKLNIMKLPTVECPECGASLKNKGTSLESYKEEEDDIQSQIDKVKKMKSDVNKTIKLNKLKDKLSNLGHRNDIGDFDPSQIRKIKSKISDLEEIEIIEQVDSELMEKEKESYNLNELVKELKVKLGVKSEDVIEDISKPEEITQITKELVSMREKQQEYDSLYKRQKKLNKSLSNIVIDDDLEIKITNDEKKMVYLKDRIRSHRHQVELRESREKVSRMKEKMEKYENRLSSSLSLLEKAKRIQTKGLQELSFAISSMINSMAAKMFDEPINISVNLTKKLKTKDILRDEVNITISYRGVNYTSINQMSGGEGDRLSIAFQVAMCKIFSCKILMLDETMPSMNEEIKHSCRKFLKKFGEDIFVIYVGHNDVKGDFNHVVSIKQTTKES